MAIFVIGDLHLSFGTDKPMDIFGWGDHTEKIKKNWIENVKTEDTVIIPGDFSWAMTLEEAIPDFEFLNSLPGTKIISKGNHDYWWNTMSKMNKFLKEHKFDTIHFLQNNSYLVEDKIIIGTRGWVTNSYNSEADYKVLKRENERLKLSANLGIEQFGKDKEIIAFLHYPPFFKGKAPKEIDFVETLKDIGVHKCYYGHLQGESHREALEGEISGIEFKLISSDYLEFLPQKIQNEIIC